MQFLCIAALLLAAVAARPDSQKPWQNKKIAARGGPQLDFKSHEIPTGPSNRPSKGLGKGNPHGPMRGHDGSDCQLGRPSQASNRGKRQSPDFGVVTDESGILRPGAGKRFGRPRGPPRGKGPNMRNPAAKGNMVFSSIFKVDNVVFQNVTNVPLKEGENIFLQLKHGGRGNHHHKQYLKLIYNATEPNKVSIDFGVLKPKNLGEIFREEDYLKEDYWL